METLKAAILAHMAEEENITFGNLAKECSVEQLDRMASAWEQEKDHLLRQYSGSFGGKATDIPIAGEKQSQYSGRLGS
jgi:hypothetical protein